MALILKMYMNNNKAEIINNICYTELVYQRINKKLNSNYSKSEIEKMILSILEETQDKDFQKTGKNYYVTNAENNIRLTINSNTFRVITVDVLEKVIKKKNNL